MATLADVYLAATDQELNRDFNELCADLVDELMHWLDALGTAYRVYTLSPSEGVNGLRPTSLDVVWDFHQIIEVEGKVQDPWLGEALPLKQYLRTMFAGQRVLVEEL